MTALKTVHMPDHTLVNPLSTYAKSRLTSVSGFSCRSRKVSFNLKNAFALQGLPAGAPSEMTMTKSGFLN
jgi:hypothetical protein